MYGFYDLGLHDIVEALNNPYNRHETRVKYSCNDEQLYQHPEWLIMTYMTRRHNVKQKPRQ